MFTIKDYFDVITYDYNDPDIYTFINYEVIDRADFATNSILKYGRSEDVINEFSDRTIENIDIKIDFENKKITFMIYIN